MPPKGQEPEKIMAPVPHPSPHTLEVLARDVSAPLGWLGSLGRKTCIWGSKGAGSKEVCECQPGSLGTISMSEGSFSSLWMCLARNY